MLGQFAADVPGGHQERRGEGVGLAFYFLHSSDPLAVQDEVPEFVGAVEAGSGAVVFVGAENYDRAIGEGQGEVMDVGGVQGRGLGSVSDFGGSAGRAGSWRRRR
jgi:hypothetical protein